MKNILISILLTSAIWFPAATHALTAQDILCHCTKFIEWRTGVVFPDFVWTTDKRVVSKYPDRGDIVIIWQPEYSLWHVGEAVLSDSDGVWVISSNAHGCGLSADYYRWYQISGVWKEK